jgi:hypothetical protein
MNREQIIETMARAIVIDRNGANCLPWSRLPASHQKPYLSDATAALSALEAAGLVVVPVEPTPAMLAAGINASPNAAPSETRHAWSAASGDIYTAMTKAAQEEKP